MSSTPPEENLSAAICPEKRQASITSQVSQTKSRALCRPETSSHLHFLRLQQYPVLFSRRENPGPLPRTATQSISRRKMRSYNSSNMDGSHLLIPSVIRRITALFHSADI